VKTKTPPSDPQHQWAPTTMYAGTGYRVCPVSGDQGIKNWSRLREFPKTEKALTKAIASCEKVCARLNAGTPVTGNLFYLSIGAKK
jgi:hypothetical protein